MLDLDKIRDTIDPYESKIYTLTKNDSDLEDLIKEIIAEIIEKNELTDDTLSARRAQWITDNCTGDDWASPRPGCNVDCQGKVTFETVRSAT